MALAITPAAMVSQWDAWRELLVPYFKDDQIYAKLWCTGVNLQSIMVARVTHLVCHARHSIGSHQQYLHPPFLSQLLHLKYLQMVDTSYYVPEGKYLKLNYETIYQSIPDNVTTIDLSAVSLYLYDGCDKHLIEFIYQHPDVNLLINHDETDLYGKGDVCNRLLIRVIEMMKTPNEFKPMKLMDSLTTLNYEALSTLKTAWSTIHSDVKAWLEQHWCPKVNTICFNKWNTDPSIEAWCHTIFSNIIHGVNLATHPLTLHSCTNDYHMLLNIPILSTIAALPHLTSLDINVVDHDMIFTTLPATLLSCTISVKFTHNSRSGLLDSLVQLLPATLVTFGLYVSLPPDPRGLHVCELGNYWTLDVIAKLPRSLSEFTTVEFPTSTEAWALLPATLRSFVVSMGMTRMHTFPVSINRHSKRIPDNSNYSIVSPHLNTITGVISSTPRINGIPLLPLDLLPLQLFTLTRFQSLTELTLVIRDQHALQEEFSAFPTSLRELTLSLEYKKNSHDYISRLTFPSQLRELIIDGNGNSEIDASYWPSLPNSLRTIILRELIIKSLPSQWPQALTYLDLSSAIGTSNYFNDTSDTVESVPDRVRYELQQMIECPGIKESLVNVPRRCVICRGSVEDVQVYVDVDRSARTFSLTVVEE